MGVRSMATLVETVDGVFFIDPGAALAPWRYGLPPHEEEVKALNEALERIYRALSGADYVIITHYHRDHYLYREGEQEHYRGKRLFVKHPSRYINRSQAVRAYVLFKKRGVESVASEVRYVDASSVELGRVKLEFSQPLYHGECGTKLGWVLAATIIEEGYTFTFASDVQGCLCDDSLRYILSRSPDFLVLSGPPTYRGFRELSENTVRLVKELKSGATLVIDHHLLRDREYAVYMEKLKSIRGDVLITTAAEYVGLEVRQLEAYRDLLWGSKKPARVMHEYEEE
jgi:predicted metallo-beta-lactamase superfamily hydrolase